LLLLLFFGCARPSFGSGHSLGCPLNRELLFYETYAQITGPNFACVDNVRSSRCPAKPMQMGANFYIQQLI